jgi:PAS domain S-box-containing protein
MVIDLFFENAFNALVVINQDGIIQNINKQAVALFGYRRQDLYDKPVETLLPERLRELHVKHIKGYMKEPRVRQMGIGKKLKALHKDGTEFDVEVGLSWTAGDEGFYAVATIVKSANGK